MDARQGKGEGARWLRRRQGQAEREPGDLEEVLAEESDDEGVTAQARRRRRPRQRPAGFQGLQGGDVAAELQRVHEARAARRVGQRVDALARHNHRRRPGDLRGGLQAEVRRDTDRQPLRQGHLLRRELHESGRVRRAVRRARRCRGGPARGAAVPRRGGARPLHGPGHSRPALPEQVRGARLLRLGAGRPGEAERHLPRVHRVQQRSGLPGVHRHVSQEIH
mmetsp:Transcript_87261/g.227629  ORF Transcript_87261/g.227629 Transcript_87261/m.227629 type:complete len:222 (+) Transcript_87261:787-1452(+)